MSVDKSHRRWTASRSPSCRPVHRSHAPEPSKPTRRSFRLMQHQAVRVGQRRVELRLQMAQHHRVG
jgi:hypothetical protein